MQDTFCWHYEGRQDKLQEFKALNKTSSTVERGTLAGRTRETRLGTKQSGERGREQMSRGNRVDITTVFVDTRL